MKSKGLVARFLTSCLLWGWGLSASAQIEQQGMTQLFPPPGLSGGTNRHLGRDSDLQKIEEETKDRSRDDKATEATANKWIEYAQRLNANPTASADMRRRLVSKEIELLERSLKVKERIHGVGSETLVPILVALGSAQVSMRGFDTTGTIRAESSYKRAIAIIEAKFGKEHKSLIPILSIYEEVLLQDRKYAEAEPVIRRYAALCSKHGYPVDSGYDYTNPEILTLNKIAYCMLRQGKQSNEIEQQLNKALAMSKKVAPPVGLRKSSFHQALDAYERHADIPDAADALIGLAEIARKRGKTADAEKYAKRAIFAYRLTQSMDNWTILNKREFRGLIQKVTSDSYSAEPLSEEQLNKAVQVWMSKR